MDLILQNATLPTGETSSVGIKNQTIVAIQPNLAADGATTINLSNQLLTPAFVDPHFHMDATLTYGSPRINQSGTLLEGIQLWGELKPNLTTDAIKQRALAYCDWAASLGLLAIRSHVDVSDPNLTAVDALIDVRETVKPFLTLQLVAFPQDGYFRSPNAAENLTRALDRGVDVIGGIPHFERTMELGRQSVTALCELAAKRSLPVDLHCDETDDPNSRHIEHLTFETQRLNLGGRVAGSHLTSMHSMDNYYVSKLLPLMAEAGVAAIANPLINITIQGRHDTYPKRRGMTRVPELLAAGVRVAYGQDCVLDPWYPLGSGDMLDAAFMGLHVAQMTSLDAMKQSFRMITSDAAAILGLDNYGLHVGAQANLAALDANDPVEAIRLRAKRTLVIARGNVILQHPPESTTLTTPGRTTTFNRRFPPAGENPT